MTKQITKVLVLHGPNLNLLGTREPEIYGFTTLSDINAQLQELTDARGAALETLQSNHEGVLIDRIHQALEDETSALLINPGGLTHTSVSLRDALAALRGKVPIVEVHLSIPEARESFRHRSLIADIVQGRISGLGPDSYLVALDAAFRLIAKAVTSS
ncbi:MAG: 3-dehydroquinate dehydratase [Myxococcales bacterium]|nr:3-dehydroquinate dehydratase [Myxococcales bacterium]